MIYARKPYEPYARFLYTRAVVLFVRALTGALAVDSSATFVAAAKPAKGYSGVVSYRINFPRTT